MLLDSVAAENSDVAVIRVSTGPSAADCEAFGRFPIFELVIPRLGMFPFVEGPEFEIGTFDSLVLTILFL
jgi:hypothetical protein